MRVRTDPPAMRWMRVSLSPITIAQPFNLLHSNCPRCFCHSFCTSVHPIPALVRSIRDAADLLRARKDWFNWQHPAPSTQAGCPSYTAAHTPPVTGPRNSKRSRGNFDFVCSPGLQCQFPPDQFCRQSPKVRQENVLNR